MFNPAVPAAGPYPTDFLTVPDPYQKTGLRIDIPVPSCAAQYTGCQEAGLLDQFDGFSVRARAQVHFSGPVNTATLKAGMFFVALNNLTQDEPGIHKAGGTIAIDQAIYDPATNTVYAKPLSVLDQHRRYALIVTDAVQDTAGNAVLPDAAFQECLQAPDGYCAALAQAVSGIAMAPRKIIAASVFTTMSATAWLEHARDVLPFVPPVVSLAEPRNTFPVATLSALVLHEQTGSNPVQFTDFSLPVTSGLLNGLGRIVVGTYFSPNFLEDDQTIRPAPTNPGLAVPEKRNVVYFNALLPASPEPPGGYPVVIFGHGFGDSRFGGPTAVAPTLARAGFAVIAITAAGHGFGPLSTVTFTDNLGNSTTLPAGGRGMDLNGDGAIDAQEGCTIVTPVAYGTRDCFRQTVVDLMQLTRVLRLGLDLDGDGKPDLDGSRIYYAGQSLGAMYGPMLTALEPSIRAAAFNVGGGSLVDIARESPAYHGFTVDTLALRTPSLLNQGATYNEDYVLPGLAVHSTTVPGAIPIQLALENIEWLGMSGDPLAFAPHLKLSPLAGRDARPALMQVARGDMTMPDPASSGLIAAAGLLSSTWQYQHSLALAQSPDLPADPHPFLVLFISLTGGAVQLPTLAGLAISLDAQQQLAGFFGSDGASIPDPNGLSKLLLGISVFTQPAVLPLDLGY